MKPEELAKIKRDAEEHIDFVKRVALTAKEYDANTRSSCRILALCAEVEKLRTVVRRMAKEPMYGAANMRYLARQALGEEANDD